MMQVSCVGESERCTGSFTHRGSVVHLGESTPATRAHSQRQSSNNISSNKALHKVVRRLRFPTSILIECYSSTPPVVKHAAQLSRIATKESNSAKTHNTFAARYVHARTDVKIVRRSCRPWGTGERDSAQVGRGEQEMVQHR